MKQYVIKPKYKKSVSEIQTFEKLIDGKKVYVSYEEIWRWGSFLLGVPETEEEIKAYLETQGYDTVEELLEDYGYDSLEDILLPDPETEEHLMLTEDYGEYFELVETWDGCGAWFTARCPSGEYSEEELDAIAQEFEDGWYEDSWTWAEENGWDEIWTDYEIAGGFEIEGFTDYESARI